MSSFPSNSKNCPSWAKPPVFGAVPATHRTWPLGSTQPGASLAFSGVPGELSGKSGPAVQLPGVAAGSPFLKAFGKPDRLLTCECERSDTSTLAQAFQMINGDAVRRKLDADDNRIGRLLKAGTADESILNELSLAILGHEPPPAQASAMLAHVARAGDRRKAWEDLAWAMLNSKEFLLKH